MHHDLPCWATENVPYVKTKLTVFLCPSATGGGDGFEVVQENGTMHSGNPFSPRIFFAHAHYVTNAGIHQPWGRPSNYAYDFNDPEPIPSNGNKPAYIDGPFYRNSGARTDVTTAVANRVHRRAQFDPEQQDLGRRRAQRGDAAALDMRPWPSENNSAGCLVGVHSGPDTHDHPQVIIHAPNHPFGHTDEMYAEHVGGANVLFGDGSVRFINQFIDPFTWVALSTRNKGDIPASDY